MGDELFDKRCDHGRGAIGLGRDIKQRFARIQPVSEFVLQPSPQHPLLGVEVTPPLQVIEEGDRPSPALRFLPFHENGKLDLQIFRSQISLGVRVLLEDLEGLEELAVRRVSRELLGDFAPGPVEARRPRGLGHGDDPEELLLGGLQLAAAEEELGKSPGDTRVGGGGEGGAAVGFLGLCGIPSHLVRDRVEDLPFGSAERRDGTLQRFIGPLRLPQQELLLDRLDPAIEPVGGEFRRLLEDFQGAGLLFAPLQQASKPEEMVDIRSLLQGDRLGLGHGFVESAGLNVDVGPDPRRAQPCRLPHRVDDLLRLVEPAGLSEQACEHPWHSGVRGPLLDRFLEVADRGARVPPDSGDLREALLDLKPTRPVVLRFHEIVAGLIEVDPILRRERRGNLVFAELEIPRDLHLQNQDHRLGDAGLRRGSARQIADLFGIEGEFCHIPLVDRDLEKGRVGSDLRRLPLEDDRSDPLGLGDVPLLDPDRHDGEEDENGVFGGNLFAGGFDGCQACLSGFPSKAGSGPGFSGEHPRIQTDHWVHAHDRFPGSVDLCVGEEQGHQLSGDLGIVRSRLEGLECDLDRGRFVAAPLQDIRLN